MLVIIILIQRCFIFAHILFPSFYFVCLSHCISLRAALAFLFGTLSPTVLKHKRGCSTVFETGCKPVLLSLEVMEPKNLNKYYLIGCIILGGPGQFILGFAMEGIGPGFGLGYEGLGATRTGRFDMVTLGLTTSYI